MPQEMYEFNTSGFLISADLSDRSKMFIKVFDKQGAVRGTTLTVTDPHEMCFSANSVERDKAILMEVIKWLLWVK